MARIFISYRRSDTGGYAGRLYDRLSSHFGANHTFIDVDHIDPGDDFARTIDARMRKADVVLALIGPRWLTVTDADGRVRLQCENDYVRIEIATAIRHHKTVIPMLFEDAGVPDAAALPDDLRALTKRQGFRCTNERFHSDVDRLIEKIEHRSGWFDRLRWGIGRIRRRFGRVSRWSRFAAVAAMLGGVGVVAGMQFIDQRGPAVTPKGRAVVPTLEPRASKRRYSSAPVLARPAPNRRLSGRSFSDARQREIMRQYNRTAKEIIDSIGR